jgi:hypothetical protein
LFERPDSDTLSAIFTPFPLAFELVDGSSVLPAQASGSTVMTKRYRVPAAVSGVPYRRGDVLVGHFARLVANPADTCAAEIEIVAVRVDYASR